jgi:hypothetical protein
LLGVAALLVGKVAAGETRRDVRIFAVALIGALAAFWSEKAFAQGRLLEGEPPPASAQPQASAASVEQAATTADESPAAALFRAAESSYLAGHVSDALRQMQRSYELSGRPELLFNLGQLQRELGQCRPALLSHRQYLLLALQGTHRGQAEQAIAELALECPEPVAAAPTEKPDRLSHSSARPSYWTPARVVGWSALGAALTASVGASYLALKAGADERELEARFKAAGAFTEADKARETAGRRAATWARALAAGAIGFTTVGITLLVLSPPKKETRTSALSIGYDADTVGAVYSGSF